MVTKRCKDCVLEGIKTIRKSPHPGPRCSSHHRARRSVTRDTAWERRLMALYGITAVEYRQVMAYQGNKCFICQRATGAVRRLAVDHDHDTGLVRGCLCKTCNRNILGFARDDIRFFMRAIEYLTDPPAVRAIGKRITPDLTKNGAQSA